MRTNELYFAVLPLIHISNVPYMGFGLTEQVLTLVPDKNFATEFSPDEVGAYISTFENRIQYLKGGHVTGYKVSREQTDDGRVIVRVTQSVE